MPVEDKTFSGFFVLDLRIWWRQVHKLYCWLTGIKVSFLVNLASFVLLIDGYQCFMSCYCLGSRPSQRNVTLPVLKNILSKSQRENLTHSVMVDKPLYNLYGRKPKQFRRQCGNRGRVYFGSSRSNSRVLWIISKMSRVVSAWQNKTFSTFHFRNWFSDSL